MRPVADNKAMFDNTNSDSEPPEATDVFERPTERMVQSFPPVGLEGFCFDDETPANDLIAGVEELHERVAYAIFATEPDVLAFAVQVSEQATRQNEETLQRALKAMWQRDESGWRTEATDRAVKVFDLIVDNVDVE